jgi:YVTN family beta-propeller protein
MRLVNGSIIGILNQFTLKLLLIFSLFYSGFGISQIESHIRKRTELGDGISPKSVVASGNGLFSAQNMMYRHTITFYNDQGIEVAKVKDEVDLNKFTNGKYKGQQVKGAPVEGQFTADGKFLWISNYQMIGAEFTNPGCDDCIGKTYDPSFLYKINTQNYQIENAVEVGSVPKFLAISPDQKILITSNWVSSDVSIVDLEKEIEIKKIHVGPHPRGIAITKDSEFAFVTVMSSTKIAVINLKTFELNYIEEVGGSPRSIVLADHDSTLYISLNTSNEVLKYNRFTEERTSCTTPKGPRSMTLSPDEKYLYVVNYFDNKFTKIATESMKIEAVVSTKNHPIGICGDWKNSEIWVACYTGKIEIFKDFKLEREQNPPKLFGLDWEKLLAFFGDYEPSMIPLPKINDSLLMAVSKPKLPTKRIVRKQVKKEVEIPVLVGDFHVIVGAFSSRSNAENKKAELISLGFPAQIIEGERLIYVSAKSFLTKADSEIGKISIADQLTDKASPWVFQKK